MRAGHHHETAKVLVSDKLSDAGSHFALGHRPHVDYRPGLSESELADAIGTTTA